MQAEAEPLIDALGLKSKKSFFDAHLPFRTYRGQRGRLELLLVTSGVDRRYQVDNVATVPAAVMAASTASAWPPALMLNCGTAGGLGSAGCKIGEVYLSEGNFYFHHRRIPIPGFDVYGHGGFPAADVAAMASELHLPRGIVSTGDSLDLSDDNLHLIQQHRAIIKDMEAAAIAWVCFQYNLPLIALKSITDLIDDPTPTGPEFLKNLELSVTNLQRITAAVLDYLEKNGFTGF